MAEYDTPANNDLPHDLLDGFEPYAPYTADQADAEVYDDDTPELVASPDNGVDYAETETKAEAGTEIEPTTTFDRSGVSLYIPTARVEAAHRLLEQSMRLVEGLEETDFHPEVHDFVRQLPPALDSTIVANVRGGTADVPAFEFNTNRLVVLPLLDRDESIKLGPSLQYISRNRLEQTATMHGSLKTRRVGPPRKPLPVGSVMSTQLACQLAATPQPSADHIGPKPTRAKRSISAVDRC